MGRKKVNDTPQDVDDEEQVEEVIDEEDVDEESDDDEETDDDVIIEEDDEEVEEDEEEEPEEEIEEVVEDDADDDEEIEEEEVVKEKVFKPRRFSLSLLISGILFVALGVIGLVWPDLTVETMALIAGIWFVVCGAGSIVDYFASGRSRTLSAWVMISGICEVILGVFFIVFPLYSMAALTTILAIIVLLAGVFQFFSALRLQRGSGNSWLIEVITGILTIVLGILMLLDLTSVIIWIAIFAIIWGVALGILAFRAPKLLKNRDE